MVVSWRDRGWATRAARPPDTAPIRSQRDPAHADPPPDEEVYGGPVDWRAPELMPGLPPELAGEHPLLLPVPVDLVDGEPRDPSYGPGVLPGVDRATGRTVAESWHAEDRGATAARRAVPAREGHPHGAAMVARGPYGGDSPETVRRYESGTESPRDPHARAPARLLRHHDAEIDRHTWEPELRPVYLRYARTKAVEAGSGPTSSPWPSPSPFLAPADRYVASVERREPVPDRDRTDDVPVEQPLTGWGI